MVTINISVAPRPATTRFTIGRRGENIATQVRFDVSALTSKYGVGTAILLFKRPTDTSPYPVSTTRDGESVIWTVSDTDTSVKGLGECELYWYVGELLSKSFIWSVYVDRDIGAATTPPDGYQSWVDTLTELGAETLRNAQDAAQSASDASGSAEDAGQAKLDAQAAQTAAETAQGKAEDAQEAAEAALAEFTTPTASAETLTAGSSATASYANGHFTFGIPKGDKGNTGDTGAAAGFGTIGATVDSQVGTPSVEVSTSGPDTEKSISFAFHNLKGQTGATGQDGADGITPDVEITEITGGHNVAFDYGPDDPRNTDFDVMDGVTPTVDAALSASSTNPVQNKVVTTEKADIIISHAEGDVASFADGAPYPLKALTINIDPVQEGSGDPSPENKRPITGWTEANVWRTGKNILPTIANSYTDSDVTITKNQDGSISLSGTASKIVFIVTYDSKILKAGTYAMHGSGNANITMNIRRGTAAGTTIVSAGANAVSFVLEKDTVTSSLFRIASGTNTDGITLFPMLELGSTATPYEPYTGQTINIEFPVAAGTVYGGTLDVTNGVLVVTSAGFTFRWGDYERIATQGSYTRKSISSIFLPGTADQSKKTNSICSCAPYVQSDKNVDDPRFYFSAGGNVNLWLPTALDDNTQITVVYPLATPITYSLPPQEISTLLGQNNIWADCGPVDVEYRADTKLYIQQLTQPTEDDMTANANIASGRFFMVGNNLYFSAASIAAGDQIVPGTNCTQLSLADALNNLNT